MGIVSKGMAEMIIRKPIRNLKMLSRYRIENIVEMEA